MLFKLTVDAQWSHIIPEFV